VAFAPVVVFGPETWVCVAAAADFPPRSARGATAARPSEVIAWMVVAWAGALALNGVAVTGWTATPPAAASIEAFGPGAPEAWSAPKFGAGALGWDTSPAPGPARNSLNCPIPPCGCAPAGSRVKL
jgi:hypothetical protein